MNSFVFGAGDYFAIQGQQFSGTLPPLTSIVKQVAGLTFGGVSMQLMSDGSGASTGAASNKIKVLCTNSGASVVSPMTQSVRHEGALLGTGDTLFFSIPGGPDEILVWLDGVGNTSLDDFDLYVQTNMLPTGGSFSQRSILPGRQEAVRLPANSSGSTHFVAVTSFQGKGAFHLRFARIKAAETKQIKVGFNFTPTGTQVSSVKALVRENMLRFFGATEGQVMIKNATIYIEPPNIFGGCVCNGGFCEVCINSTYPATECFMPTVTVRLADIGGLGGGAGGTTFLAHEWGHCILGFQDEYERHLGPGGTLCHTDFLCGHSLMGSETVKSNFCTIANHKLDTSLPGHVCATCSGNGTIACPGAPTCAICPSAVSNNWGALAGRVAVVETSSADTETYFGHLGLLQLMTVVP